MCFAEIPAQRGLSPAHEREGTGPEHIGQRAGVVRNLIRQSGQNAGVGDQHGRRHLTGTALGAEQRLDAHGGKRIAADAVHGVRGHDDALTVRDHTGCVINRGDHGFLVCALVRGTHERLLSSTSGAGRRWNRTLRRAARARGTRFPREVAM